MPKEIEKALTKIEKVFNDFRIKIKTDVEPGRITLRGNEEMKDAGFTTDNIVLDMFYDDDIQILFIGLLRLPKKMRGKGESRLIVEELKKWADKKGYVSFVDACEGCDFFWSKMGFHRIFRDKYGFDIMGCETHGENLKLKWEELKKTKVYKTFLACHQ